MVMAPHFPRVDVKPFCDRKIRSDFDQLHNNIQVCFLGPEFSRNKSSDQSDLAIEVARNWTSLAGATSGYRWRRSFSE
jgi:hypothetical protein